MNLIAMKTLQGTLSPFRLTSTLCLFLLGCVTSTAPAPSLAQLPGELSGIDRYGDKLFFVDDEATGIVFQYSIKGLETQRVIPLNDPCRFVSGTPPLGDEAEDLEAVRFFPALGAIGLSESGKSLFGRNGKIFEFPDSFKEFGNRGLEGFDLQGQHPVYSVVAVMEGGYPERRKLPAGSDEWKKPRTPSVITFSFDSTAAIPITPTLSIPVPLHLDALHSRYIDPVLQGENEPYAQRFRAPAILWHEKHGASCIILLSSENHPDNPLKLPPCTDGERESPRFSFKLIQRFSADGHPVGDPINLDDNKDIRAAGLAGACQTNWEGMGWFVRGESLILVNDKIPSTPTAVVVDLPDSWK